MNTLTVGITCYSEGKLLTEALNSVYAQDFTDWECLVINDASPDDETNQICRNIDEPRVRVIWCSENGGLSKARNIGVQEAETDWYIPLDADDLLPPGALNHIVQAIRINPKAGIVVGHKETFGLYHEILRPVDLKRQDILFKQTVAGVMPFHRKTWDEVGGFDQKLSWGNQDWDFLIGVMEKNIPWAYVPETIYIMRAREGSMSRSYGMRWPEIVEYIYLKHQTFFDEFNAGSQFLAQGYRRGAVAAHQNKNRQRARKWAWRAIWNGDRSRIMFSIFLKNWLMV